MNLAWQQKEDMRQEDAAAATDQAALREPAPSLGLVGIRPRQTTSLQAERFGGRQTLHLQLRSAGLGLLRYESGGASEGQLRRVHTAPCADLSKKSASTCSSRPCCEVAAGFTAEDIARWQPQIAAWLALQNHKA